MKVKTITYKRIFNLGNYESKHLEWTAEINDEDPLIAASELMQFVETKVREQTELILDAKDLRKEIKELKQELEQLKAKKDKLTGEEPDPDDIPFDPQQLQSNDDTEDVNKYF